MTLTGAEATGEWFPKLGIVSRALGARRPSVLECYELRVECGRRWIGHARCIRSIRDRLRHLPGRARHRSIGQYAPLARAVQWRGAGTLAAATSAATGTALVAGIVGGLACAAAALVFPSTGKALLALAVCLPLLLLQDTWRHAFLARGSPSAAFLNDLAWAVFLIPAILIPRLRGEGRSRRCRSS